MSRKEVYIRRLLGRVRNVYIGINGELTDGVEVLMRNGSDITAQRDKRYWFYSLYWMEIQNVQRRMADRGYALREHRYYPSFHRQEGHELVGHNEEGEQDVVSMMRPNPMNGELRDPEVPLVSSMSFPSVSFFTR